MTSEYSDIFSRFLLKVTDYNLAQTDEYLANEMMAQWLHSALSYPYVSRMFASIIADDDVEEIEYELKNPTSEEADQEFVEEIFASGMVIQWIKPQVNSVLNTQQILSNSEQKFYSQANQLEVLQELLNSTENSLRKAIRDRGTFYNPYLSGDL